MRDGEDEVRPGGHRRGAENLLQRDQVVETGFVLEKIGFALFGQVVLRHVAQGDSFGMCQRSYKEESI